MPRIPLDTSTATLPARSGLPLRIQQAQPVGQPAASQEVGAIGGQALSGLGTALVQAGELGIRTEDLQARLRNADALILGKTQYQEWGIDHAAEVAEEQQNPDYTTLAKRIRARGEQSITERAKGLSPKAAQYFREDATQRLGVTLQQALKVEGERRERLRGVMVAQGKAQAFQRLMNATDELDQVTARGELVGLLQESAALGLMTPEAAGAELADLDGMVEVGQVRRQMQLHPVATAAALKTEKRTMIGQVPTATLQQEADRQVVHAMQLSEAMDRQTERKLAADQEQRYAQSIGTLYGLAARQQVSGIQAWQQTLIANQDQYRKEDFTSGLHTAQSLLEGFQARGEARVAAAETKQQFAQMGRLILGLERGDATREDVLAWIGTGQPEAIKHGLPLLKDQDGKREKFAYNNAYEYHVGNEWIVEGVGLILGGRENAYKEENAPALQRLIEAQTLYQSSMQAIWKQAGTPEAGYRAVQAQAPAVSRSILDHYSIHFKDMEKKKLPKLPFEIEDTFQSHGLDAAKLRLQQLKDANAPGMNDLVYKDLAKNLKRRQDLQWLGGQPQGPDAPATPKPPEDTRNWLKRFWDNLTEGGVPIPPGEGQ